VNKLKEGSGAFSPCFQGLSTQKRTLTRATFLEKKYKNSRPQIIIFTSANNCSDDFFNINYKFRPYLAPKSILALIDVTVVYILP
jgi:hypothetical protein